MGKFDDILIFDSNCHPTLNGKWFGKNIENSFEKLFKSMESNKISGCLAVGLDNFEKFNLETYVESCNKYEKIYPVAGLNPVKDNFVNELNKIKKLGYKGIKVHPRLSKIDLKKDQLTIINNLNVCGQFNLPVFFCTYFYDSAFNLIVEDPLEYVEKMISLCEDTKFILMHSGYDKYKDYFLRLTKYDNVLFDLSYTLMNSYNQIVTQELIKIFDKYYDRIFVGSDWPEFEHNLFVEKLIFYLEDLDSHKINKILSKNITDLLG